MTPRPTRRGLLAQPPPFVSAAQHELGSQLSSWKVYEDEFSASLLLLSATDPIAARRGCVPRVGPLAYCPSRLCG